MFTVRWESNLYMQVRSGSGGSPASLRRPGFIHWPVRSRFMLSEVAVAFIFRRVLWISPVSMIPPFFHLHLCVVVTRRTNG